MPGEAGAGARAAAPGSNQGALTKGALTKIDDPGVRARVVPSPLSRGFGNQAGPSRMSGPACSGLSPGRPGSGPGLARVWPGPGLARPGVWPGPGLGPLSLGRPGPGPAQSGLIRGGSVPAWIARTVSTVSASAQPLSGRCRSTRANRSAIPPG